MNDDFDFLKNFDFLPEELKDKVKQMKALIISEKNSNDLAVMGASTLKIGIEDDIPWLMKMGNTLIMVAGVFRLEEDVNEFEALCRDFAVKKLKEALDKGGETADILLDNISGLDDEELKKDIFSLLEGKESFDEIKERINKNGKDLE